MLSYSYPKGYDAELSYFELQPFYIAEISILQVLCVLYMLNYWFPSVIWDTKPM